VTRVALFGVQCEWGSLREHAAPLYDNGKSVEQVREWIREAARIAALAGAGLSAESGVPTFRGAGGLWRQYRPEDLATPEAFFRDPRLVWEWYDWRRTRIAQAAPNPAHYALAELERRKPGFTLITQNVDGLEEQAGCRNVLRLHGDIWTLRCVLCGRERRDRTAPLAELPPHCECGALERPGVVWFGEPLPGAAWQQAEQAAAQAELFLVIGTSAVVYPAAGLVWLAKESGARVVEINLEETAVSPEADASFKGKAGEILPSLLS
jgi:NAD-dependent deacetylase